MSHGSRLPIVGGIILFVLIGTLLVIVLLSQQGIIGSASSPTNYHETFDEAGGWTMGQDVNASGVISDSQYVISVDLIGDIFWVTGGEEFDDGIYEVEAKPIDGTIDNGYGMLIRVDEEKGKFYIFKVSSDGYVFIGLCDNSCLETEVLVSQDWFASAAVVQGHGVTNTLRIKANGPEMGFFVNDIEVGQVTDNSYRIGDIGLLAETFAPGGVRVAFDNFSVTPLEDD